MSDPASQTSLSLEEIESYAQTADFAIVQAQTPGLTPLSTFERLLLAGFFFVVGTLLYVHLDIKPFLPLHLSEEDAYWVLWAAFAAMGLGGMALLLFLARVLLNVAQSLWYKVFPRQPRAICPRCGKWNLLSRFVKDMGCPHCGADLIYCARCGKPTNIGPFMAGGGCIHCGSRRVFVRW